MKPKVSLKAVAESISSFCEDRPIGTRNKLGQVIYHRILSIDTSNPECLVMHIDTGQLFTIRLQEAIEE